MNDLPILQKTYDFVLWYVPILDRLPRNHKFTLGDRLINGLYDFLEGLIQARFAQEKFLLLSGLNVKLDILRYQTRLLMDLKLLSVERYKLVAQKMNDIGVDLGGWLKQQRQRYE